MYITLVIVIVAIWFMALQLKRPAAVVQRPTQVPVKPETLQLAEYAERLFSEKRWIAAEKAFLNVLRVDHRNVSAYSHLGIIYATQKNQADALECFQLAAKLQPSAATYHNLGLGYFDNRNFMKAAAAFEKAIILQPSAARYVGLSKARRALTDHAGVVTALKGAVAIEPSLRLLQLLEQAQIEAGDKTEAEVTRQQIAGLQTEHGGVGEGKPIKASA